MVVCITGLYLHVAGQSIFERCYTVAEHRHCFRTYLQQPHRQKTWDAARKHCRNIDDKAYSLVAIDDVLVQDALAHFVDIGDLVGGQFIWTGITQKTQNEWFWIDGTHYTGKLPALSEGTTFYCIFIAKSRPNFPIRFRVPCLWHRRNNDGDVKNYAS